MKNKLLKNTTTKRKVIFHLSCVILLLITTVASAKNTAVTFRKSGATLLQSQADVTGKVTDAATGETLPGVSVSVKGATTATVTNANGEFSLNVKANSTLVFSYLGYTTVEVLFTSNTSVNVKMQPSLRSLDEVVVIGYGTQKKTSLTAAVSTLAVADITQKPVVNITNSLVGRVSGLIATQGNGEPGQDGSNITIRGPVTNGRTQPLTVVDGVPRDFSRLDPNSIETVTILKDAAAVAPYGVAGANGVILITTKQGKLGKPTLSYNGYYGFQNPTSVPRFVNSVQYALLRNEAVTNDAVPGSTVALPYSARDIELYGNGLDPDGHANARPLEDIMQKNSPMQYHNVSLSGGTEDIQYFSSLGYNRQEGMWNTTFINKFNGSLGLTAKATKTTTVNLRINGYQEDQNYPGVGAGTIIGQAQRQNPTYPVRYSNGVGAGYIGQTLYGEINQSGYENVKNNVLLTQLSIDQKLPIKGLSLKGIVSYDSGPDPLGFSPNQSSIIRKYNVPIPFTNPVLPNGVTEYGPGVAYTFPISYQGEPKPVFRETFNENKMVTFQGLLNYGASFGKSDVTGLLVVESREVKWQNYYAQRKNYNLTIDELDFGGTAPTDVTVGGQSGGQSQLGYVYRIGYSYDKKYLLEASGRYDGSFVFGPGNRFGFFPAFSAGWRISEEGFMRKFTWLDNLKLRGSYGESGNYPNIPNANIEKQYQYLDQFSVNPISAVIGGNATQGIIEKLQGNPEITWEKAKKANIGLEATLWNGLLSFEADYFYEKRSNLLVDQVGITPAEYGVAIGQVNGGNLSNRGIDLTISSFKQFSSDLRLDVRGTFTFAKSKIIELFENPSTRNNPNRSETGRPLGQQFGLKALGYYTTDDFVDPTLQFPVLKPGIPIPNYGTTLRPGDLKYADINGPTFDGKPDGKVDANDFTDIGNPQTPQIVYGFAPHLTYKNFDLDLLFQGSARSNIYLDNYYVNPFLGSGSASELVYLNHWTPTNPNATYPRISGTPSSNNSVRSSWFMRNDSYIRLKSAEVGYTFSNKLLGNTIKSLRIYSSGQNIFFWTPGMKEKIDPENSSSNQNYYQQRVITLGLNASF